ncbi:hypothetical protein C0J52_12468 [Blattella germanica]|nr:hypothetical protein C0J52_12468 [Blattella germanica]
MLKTHTHGGSAIYSKRDGNLSVMEIDISHLVSKFRFECVAAKFKMFNFEFVVNVGRLLRIYPQIQQN